MAGLAFSNIAMLAGLSGLAVPVLIHLLMRRKAVLMRFSSVQFFKQQEQHARRRNIRNFLLLVTRLLLLALLVTAFARPYLSQSVGRVFRKRVMFVIDASASMQAADGANTRWEQARAHLLKEIRALDPQDRVGIVRCSTDPETLVPLSSPEAVVARVEQITPGFGTTDLAEGLLLANKILRMDDQGEAEICIISDLQRSSCEKIASVSIPSTTKLHVIPIGDPMAANNAVVSIDATNVHQVQIAVGNFSADQNIARAMDLQVDGRSLNHVEINLEPGAATNVTVSLPSLRSGWHDIRANLSGSDSFALDDSRALTIFIPPPVRILCAEPAMERRVFERETFFLDCALNATTASADANSSALNIKVETLPPDAIAGAIATDSPDVVILPALPHIPPQFPAALERYLERGGKVIVFMGEAVQPNIYREQLEKALPAVPVRIEGDPEQPDQYWHLQPPDPKSPMFAIFSKPNSGNIALVQFKRRYALVLTPATQVLATFEDGAPFIVSRRVGVGQMVLVNTSATTSWTDWPKRKTFVPWLHSLVQMLAGADRGKTVVSSANCGEFTEIDAKQPVMFRDERGRSKTLNGDASGKVRIDHTEPGVFRLSDPAGRELQRIAVNVPAAESDLSAMPDSEFNRRIGRTPPDSSSAAIAIDGVRQRPLWPTLLGACLVLLLVEVVLANRTDI